MDLEAIFAHNLCLYSTGRIHVIYQELQRNQKLLGLVSRNALENHAARQENMK